MLHGTAGEVIDLTLGQELFAAATAGPEYRERLQTFMMNACNAAASSPSP